MDTFRTTFPVKPSDNKITHAGKILSLGSCFSENMGNKLSYYKFPIIINPFGIIYNPESIATSMEILISGKTFTGSDLFEHQGIWNSFYHHSRFSNTNKNACLLKINESSLKAAEMLKQTEFLILTFGTAWVYEFLHSGEIVSNCHKVPAKEFKRYRLPVQQITERFKTLFQTIFALNTELKVILTVSPVRHLKDGAEENLLSKATLIMAVHELISSFEQVSYFPSYEIMMDDLRDYRFYANDMIHPSTLAINYIWEKFESACIHPDSKKLMNEIDRINLDLNHRPFNPKSEAHQKFLQNILNRISSVESENSMIDFTQEKEIVKQQMQQ